MKTLKYTFGAFCIYMVIMLSIAYGQPHHSVHKITEVVDSNDAYWVCDAHKAEWKYEDRTGLFMDEVTDKSKNYFK